MGRCWLLGLVLLVGCPAELDERGFRREAERAYAEVHPGFTIYRRDAASTTFVRGDQVDELDVAALWERYQSSDKAAFFDEWKRRQREEAEARRRTLVQAAADLVPVIKSGRWIRAQDLGAIGPERIRKQLRPWRQEVADDVFAVLGIPEEKLGIRYASIEEVETSTPAAAAWLSLAIRNVERDLDVADGGNEVRDAQGAFLALDLPNRAFVSSLILSDAFRRRLLARLERKVLGAAVPIRNVLIVFDPEEFTARKPVRARAHQLYDTQNHPSFRGLLQFDAETVQVLEPAYPPRTP
jgi:hypothetical protein